MDVEGLKEELVNLRKRLVEALEKESPDVFREKMSSFVSGIIESFSERDELKEKGAIKESDDRDLIDSLLGDLQFIKDECFDYSETRPKKKSPWIDIRNTPSRPADDVKVLVKNIDDEDERCSYPMIAMYDEEYDAFEAVGRVGEGHINCLNVTHFMFIPGLKND